MSTTVWIYVNTNQQVGDIEHIEVFPSVDAAETWLEETIQKAWPLNTTCSK
jgi:hypothetical protein